MINNESNSDKPHVAHTLRSSSESIRLSIQLLQGAAEDLFGSLKYKVNYFKIKLFLMRISVNV